MCIVVRHALGLLLRMLNGTGLFIAIVILHQSRNIERMGIEVLTESFVSSVTVGGAATTLLSIGCLFWVAYASGSSHPLRFRALKLIYGKMEIGNKAIAGFLDEQMGLASFRVSTGLGRRIRTAGQAARLVEWMEKHDEGVDSVRRAGCFFDFECPGVEQNRLYNKWLVSGVLSLSLVLALGFSSAMMGVVASDALVKVRKTGEWLHFTPNAAYAFGDGWLHDAEPLTPTICDLSNSSAAAERTQLSVRSVDILCKTFAMPDAEVFIAETIVEQRRAFGLLALTLAWFLHACFVWLGSGIAAHQMVTRINRRQRAVALTLMPMVRDEPNRTDVAIDDRSVNLAVGTIVGSGIEGAAR